MSGLADIIVERLRAAGTRAIFGVPGGGGNLDLIDAARIANLPFVLTSTETGAAIAALAQAEVLGRPGACLTTLGPGAASVMNGVACARLERAPILVVTDSHPADAQGRFLHQHVDQVALFAPITKWSGRLMATDAAGTIDRAFEELASLPPGPVHLDWPSDVQMTGAGVPSSGADGPPVTHQSSAIGRGLRAVSARFEALLTRSRKPLLLVGLGARQPGDAEAIRLLCEHHLLPAVVTYKAKGVVPDAHACFAGVFTNGAIERPLIEQADLLIGIGLDPIELLPRAWTFAPPIVAINRWRVADDHVPFADQWIADVATAVAALDATMTASDWDMDEVARIVHAQHRVLDIQTDGTGGMPAQRAIDVVADALAATSRVTVDAGAHMFPATMRWPVSEPNGLLISNGLSTMGFALPAAIGAAWLGSRTTTETPAGQGPVVALTGDGGLLMCAGELLTAAREKLRLIVIVFSDASLSLIEIKQQARRLSPAGVSIGAVNWASLAEGLGVAGFVASSDDDLTRAIEQAVATDGPSLIEARIDPSNYGDMLKVLRG